MAAIEPYTEKFRKQADTFLQTFMVTIRTYAKQQYTADDVHGIGHIQRVLTNGKTIMAHTGGYSAILETLVWLHDIGRKSEKDEGRPHAKISAEMADAYLKSIGIPQKTRGMIVAGILSHSFSIGGKAEYLEAQILSDADKLDAIGAVGIFRASCHHYSNAEGVRQLLDHFDEKLLILGEKLYLEESKKIAAVRIERLHQFKKDLLEELA